MPVRIIPIVNEHIYHITTKAINDLKVFPENNDYNRMVETIRYYKVKNRRDRFSIFRLGSSGNNKQPHSTNKVPITSLVNIISYCLMPTHIHLLLSQAESGGISQFISIILNSYTKYFNLKYDRKGPMWEGRFKNILATSDSQLLHTSCYIHLNPVTAFLASTPLKWVYSSYHEYMNLIDEDEKICNFKNIIPIKDPKSYEQYCLSNIEILRQRAQLKSQFKAEIYTPGCKNMI